MPPKERAIRITGTVVGELIAAAVLLLNIVSPQTDRLFIAAFTPVLVLLPLAAEGLLRCRLGTGLFLFCVFYALGPMLGHCVGLYYVTCWWDKMLHVFGGIAFSILGYFLFIKLTGSDKRRLTAAIFALCFSMAVAVAWEFFEYGAEQLFGLDMQNDSVVGHISSYKLGDSPGKVGRIDGITQVVIDGVPLPFDGYLDIGLHDTMWDMLLESLGAALTAICCVFTRLGRRLIAFPEQWKQADG